MAIDGSVTQHPPADAENQSANRAIALALAVVAFVWGVNGIYLSVLSRYSVAAFWIADVVQWLVIPGAIVFWLAARHNILPRDYGFDPARLTFAALAWGAVAAVTFYPAYFQVKDAAWALLGEPGGFFALEDVFPGGAMGKVIWIYSALTAGIIESAFFIGLPWLLWSRKAIGSALFFSGAISVLFAAVHWEQGPHIVVAAMAFSLVACAWFFRMRTLWPVVIGHVIIDLIAFDDALVAGIAALLAA